MEQHNMLAHVQAHNHRLAQLTNSLTHRSVTVALEKYAAVQLALADTTKLEPPVKYARRALHAQVLVATDGHSCA